MKKNPMVTVIIPSYNHAQYLPKRIDSILSQTFNDYELFIVDDCSPDESDAVIRQYLDRREIVYTRNMVNSGTPFSTWKKGVTDARGKYIWICESDDFADETFLERAVTALEADERNVLFYCNSNVVDESNTIIGSTSEYFDEVWKNSRWKTSFIVDGPVELSTQQIFGQTVPNMSSALIRQDAFKKAYDSYLLQFKLTGDWLFIGLVMQYGQVVFTPDHLSNFRKHEVTSRVRVKSARSQAEFILTKYELYKRIKNPTQSLLDILSNDAIRFLYEDSSAWEVIKNMFSISFKRTIEMGSNVAWLLIRNPEYYRMFKERKSIARS